jgi:hypothetical protein
LAALCLFGGLIAPCTAAALSLRELGGWWIAIDDTFPKLWQRGDIVPMEELLIVNPDGRMENRVMNFWSGSAHSCAETRVCSDAPVIASTRLTLKGDRLSMGARSPGAGRLDSGRNEALIRRTAVTGTPLWSATLQGRVLVLRAPGSGALRTFARVEPRRLQRLRAGMRVSGQSASRQWRCFLGHATARDAAFAAVRPANPVSPPFLDSYLRVASYLVTLDSMSVRPTPDDPAARAYMAHETEEIMIEEFADARLPVSVAESRALRAKVAFVMQRAGGGTPNGAAPRLSVSDAEIGAFGRGLGDEPDAKRLFCRE